MESGQAGRHKWVCSLSQETKRYFIKFNLFIIIILLITLDPLLGHEDSLSTLRHKQIFS